jgi:hypothetical protein
MGLDMYLTGEKFIWSEYATEGGRVPGLRGELTSLFPELAAHPSAGDPWASDGLVTSVEATFIYWRKANQIHNWFVNNVQNGTDDQGEYSVSFEQLQDLYDVCKEVYNSKKVEKLPCQGGFFFGPTEYDEYYYQGLLHTMKMLEFVLKKDEENQFAFRAWRFKYSSSW